MAQTYFKKPTSIFGKIYLTIKIALVSTLIISILGAFIYNKFTTEDIIPIPIITNAETQAQVQQPTVPVSSPQQVQTAIPIYKVKITSTMVYNGQTFATIIDNNNQVKTLSLENIKVQGNITNLQNAYIYTQNGTPLFISEQ